MPTGFNVDVIQVRPKFPGCLRGPLWTWRVGSLNSGGVKNVVDVSEPTLLLLQCKIRLVVLLVALRNLE